MNKTFLQKQIIKRGLGLLEIVIALVIMAVAMIPLFTFIHKGTQDTDSTASQSFAITKAAEILGIVLDTVPFEALREGSPVGFLRTDDIGRLPIYQKQGIDTNWAGRMAKMLFNLDGTASTPYGFPCEGIIADPRGISYLVSLRIEDVYDKTALNAAEKRDINTEFPSLPDDLSFSFCVNPNKLQNPSWAQKYAPEIGANPSLKTEVDLPSGLALPANTIYSESDFVTPKTVRYVQKMATEKVNYSNDPKVAFCTMKRLVIQVQWNLEVGYYNQPRTNKGNIQRIHLQTLKADLSR
ncbi:MAG: hypothetical protein HQM08_09805 [Candidatus Riflebacteria bacterium]|nr:hypothetical protein [Candidatus Riflebacteria bacterium]